MAPRIIKSVYTTCFVLYTILNASIRFLNVNNTKSFFKELILLKKKTATTTKLNERPRPHVPGSFFPFHSKTQKRCKLD